MASDESDGRTDGVTRWLLLTGDRRAVAAAMLVALCVSLAPLALVLPVDVAHMLRRPVLSDLFTTMLSGIILLVSIVVSVASLVASQEFTPVGQQQQQIEQSVEFRRETESVLDAPVSPAEPAAFLRSITRAVLQHAQDLDAAVDDGLDGWLDAYLSSVAAETERVNRTLGDSGFGAFEMLLAALEYDYARQLHELRQLRVARGDDLTDEATAAVDDLIEALQFFATAREYFKSLYFEREFANLARDLLFVSLPAILVVSYVLLTVDAGLFDGTAAGVPLRLVVASVGYTVAFAPFVVLTAYVVRVATIAKRSLSSGPFIVDDGPGTLPGETPFDATPDVAGADPAPSDVVGNVTERTGENRESG